MNHTTCPLVTINHTPIPTLRSYWNCTMTPFNKGNPYQGKLKKRTQKFVLPHCQEATSRHRNQITKLASVRYLVLTQTSNNALSFTFSIGCSAVREQSDTIFLTFLVYKRGHQHEFNLQYHPDIIVNPVESTVPQERKLAPRL